MTFTFILAGYVGFCFFLSLLLNLGKAPTLGGKLFLLHNLGGRYLLYSVMVVMFGFLCIQNAAELCSRHSISTEKAIYGTLITKGEKPVFVSGTSNCVFIANTTNGTESITINGVVSNYVSTNSMDKYTFTQVEYFVPKWVYIGGRPFVSKKEIKINHTFFKAKK